MNSNCKGNILCDCEMCVEIWANYKPKKYELTDAEMLDWLQKIMTPKSNYCEVFFAGLRYGDADAVGFQIESNPEKFTVANGKNIREAISNAMDKYPFKNES